MKIQIKNKILLIILHLSVLGFSQQKINISGKITDSKIKNIVIEGTEFKDSIKIKPNLTFNDSLLIPYKGIYKLLYKNQKFDLYLTKNSNLEVDLKDSTIAFTGVGAYENNYLASKKLLFEPLKIKPKKGIDIIIEQIGKNNNKNNVKLQELLQNTKNLDSTFIQLENRNLYFNQKLIFKNKMLFLNKYSTFNPSDSLINIAQLKDSIFSFDNEADFLFSDNYKGYLSSVLKDSVEVKNLKKERFKGKFYIEKIKKLNSNYIKNYSLKLIHSDFNADNIYVDTLFVDYLQLCTNLKQREFITKKYNKLKATIPGSAMQDFAFENYNGGKTKLSDLKGKYVYISIWASWCGPCLNELNDLNKKVDFYKDKNIKFLTISIDKKREYTDWRKTVARNKLKSINLYANNELESDFVKNFDFSKLERYIIIDPEGKIILSDAPSPSDVELDKILDSHLNQSKT